MIFSVSRSLAGLLEAAPDAMACVAADDRIVGVNAQAELLFGRSRTELLGGSLSGLVPGAAQVIAAARARYAADPHPWPLTDQIELSGRRGDGSPFPAEISLSVVDVGGEMLVTVSVRDGTDRWQAFETNARLAAIIQSSPDAIITKSLDQVVTSWNPAAEQLYGYTAAEMIGRHIYVLFPAGERAREEAILARVVRGERVEGHQTYRVRRDGSLIAVAVSLAPIRNAGGHITGITTVVKDLTERERADARFTGLLEAAPDAMVCVDGRGQVTVVNARAEQLFGYARSELTGQPVQRLVPGAAQAIRRLRRDRGAQPAGHGLEMTCRRSDGSTFPAEISAATIDTGQGLLTTAAIRDVTERQRAEAEREKLLKLAERQQLHRRLHQAERLEGLGQLAGGVAHDFNNLLGVISSYTAFVAEDIGRTLPGQAGAPILGDIEQVQLAAQRAAGLTQQLLAFARKSAVVQPRVLSFNEVIETVLRLLQRTLGEHVEVTTDLDPGLGLVLADPGQLEQVLVNLAVNARDAMPDGGTLTIATAETEVAPPPDGDGQKLPPGRYASMRVADSGRGMPADIADHAFEPFFTTKPPGAGTGLGLATVYGIITQAGGDVLLDSEPGAGTTVTVLLPVTGQPRDERGPAPEQVPRGHGELVLVVEDEAALREVIRRMLARNGYQVVTAAGGQEAIDIAAASDSAVDVLLTDMVMPGLQGREVAARILAGQPGIAVLYMSGYMHAPAGGGDGDEAGIKLLEKPFTEAALLARLAGVLRGRAG